MKLNRGALLLLCAGVVLSGLGCLGCSPASTMPESNPQEANSPVAAAPGATAPGATAPGATAPGAIAVRPISPGSTVPRPGGSPAIAQAVRSDNAFGKRLFEELRRSQPDQNLFLSPFSVALALQMTYNGASGSTQAAMARALALSARFPFARRPERGEPAAHPAAHRRTGCETANCELAMDTAGSARTRRLPRPGPE